MSKLLKPLIGWGAVILAMVLVIGRVDRVSCADDKNITRLLNNQAIVSKQIMCVLEKSPCDQLGRQLKGPLWGLIQDVGAHRSTQLMPKPVWPSVMTAIRRIVFGRPGARPPNGYPYKSHFAVYGLARPKEVPIELQLQRLMSSSEAALPEVILRNCRNCSPQQAQNAQRLTNFLQTRFPDVWAMLIRKYRGV